jgi:hypothetical protein
MKLHIQEIKNIFVAILVVTLIICWDQAHTEKPVMAQEVVESPVASPEPLETIETPETYIRKVFGQDSQKAFLLLQGNGQGSCAENRHLDPKAFNRNWSKTEGVYWSTDWSIFQVNDKFHPVEELNLDTDWKANIDYAKRMFDRDGGTFAYRWTCGKYYKSLGYDI